MTLNVLLARRVSANGRVFPARLSGAHQKHADTKFVKCDVQKFPFFVPKLQVKVLPCVIMFFDGVAVDRIVGCVFAIFYLLALVGMSLTVVILENLYTDITQLRRLWQHRRLSHQGV